MLEVVIAQIINIYLFIYLFIRTLGRWPKIAAKIEEISTTNSVLLLFVNKIKNMYIDVFLVHLVPEYEKNCL